MQPKVLFICIGIHESQTEGSRSLCARRRRGRLGAVVDVVARQKRSHSPNTKQVRSLEIKRGSPIASQIFSRLRSFAEKFLGAFGRSHQRGQDG
ncbi:hypothetical protein NDA03_20570 [Trichocoleus sp. Lan]|uniref:hypothetical protein n=1 Tax=Trichocoleus sp. Lan TaxID=2933927 RepID=UPI0032993099